jgi:hypothetical protein
VDLSATMLSLLRERTYAAISDASIRLQTHHVSALAFTPVRTYDLIVTHFFLDCLTTAEIASLCVRFASHLAPGTRWLVSDFRIPDGAMRLPALALVRMLYLTFRLLTGLRTSSLPDHAAALATAGFTLTAQQHSLAGLLTSELWAYTPAMQLPPQRPRAPHPPDPVPDPEPVSPSLPGPDPGVFHPASPPTPAPTK